MKRFLNKLFRRDNSGETPEFLDLVEGSVEGLRLQTRAHQGVWRLGEEERWHIDQELGQLVFTFPEIVVTAPAQIVGTFDTEARTWRWAWANDSVVDTLKQDSLRVRAYGEQHGIRRLTEPGWPAEELDCWRMTALAAHLACADGAYRGPAGRPHVFMTFGQILLKKRAPEPSG